LRVARFAARYAHLGFSIAPETLLLMREMAEGGELSSLTAERVWQEMHGALGECSPDIFFDVLRQCGALTVILPELDALFGVPQPEKHHPEIDTGIHSLMVLQQAALLSNSTVVRFAALTHDLGKGLTQAKYWPSHHGHEKKGLSALKKLAARLRVPNDHLGLAERVMEFHTHCHRVLELKASTVQALLESLGAYREVEKLDQFLLACEADARGRLGLEDNAYPQAAWLKAAYLTANKVNTKEFVEQGFSGAEIGKAISNKRIEAIQLLKDEVE